MQAYHFFSPLLAPNQAWSAFEWQTFPAIPAEPAHLVETADVCLPLAKQHPLWLPAHPAWLANPAFREFIKKLGCDQVIPALPAGSATNQDCVVACQAMRRDGIHLALGIGNAGDLKNLSVTTFDHLAFDVESARGSIPLIELINAHQNGFQLVGRGVTTHDQFEWGVAKRFSLLSGEFVATVDQRSGLDADTTRLKLLKLLSLVVQDADTREIEEIFRQEPKLSYNLLRLVNSVAVGPKSPITGFNQAITVLGRRQLQRWLQLLIYANQFGQAGHPNPLLQLAAARGKLLEGLAACLPPVNDVGDTGEAAFMIGIFSLLDILLRLPMNEVLAALPLAQPIAAALSQRTGVLGQLLEIVVLSESGRHAEAAKMLDTLGIDARTHMTAQVNAYGWASRITLE